jgi:hypothetical protein
VMQDMHAVELDDPVPRPIGPAPKPRRPRKPPTSYAGPKAARKARGHLRRAWDGWRGR